MTLHQLRTISSYGRRAGSARVRVFDWLDWLNLESVNETYIDGASNSLSTLLSSPVHVVQAELRLRTLARTVGADTVLLSRQASPFSNGKIEAQLLRMAAHGVYDFDDALMHSPRGRLDHIWSKRSVWKQSVAAADVALAGNDYLANEADRQGGNVVVVPSCVNPGDYEVKTNFEIIDIPRAIWLGSPSTESYLRLITTPLLTLHASLGLRLTVVSAGAANLGDLEPMIDRVDWSPTSFGSDLARADFGIMPLDDNDWTRGKCAYKLLQYAASCLPMVGSPVGANASVLKDANGYAASSTDEWVSAMEALVGDSVSNRAQRGETGRTTIIRDYSFAAWESTWRSAMNLTI